MQEIISISEKNISRRDIFKTAGGIALAAGMVSFSPAKIFSQTIVLPQATVDALNFILQIKYFQAGLYGAVKTFTIPAADQTILNNILADKTKQATFLKNLIAPKDEQKPELDFAKNFPDVLSSYQEFLAMAQAFEDVSIRAIKGVMSQIMPVADMVDLVLRVQAVDARHSVMIRSIRGKNFWIAGNDSEGAPAEVYLGEDFTNTSGSQSGEAFDESLDANAVLTFLNKFRK